MRVEISVCVCRRQGNGAEQREWRYWLSAGWLSAVDTQGFARRTHARTHAHARGRCEPARDSISKMERAKGDEELMFQIIKIISYCNNQRVGH